MSEDSAEGARYQKDPRLVAFMASVKKEVKKKERKKRSGTLTLDDGTKVGIADEDYQGHVTKVTHVRSGVAANPSPKTEGASIGETRDTSRSHRPTEDRATND